MPIEEEEEEEEEDEEEEEEEEEEDVSCFFSFFYLVHFGGLYIECKKMHGIHNIKCCRRCACVELKNIING